MEAGESAGATTTRDRIVTAATDLLVDGGRDAVSTRAVSAAAGVQAPTIYRIFGSKQDLLDTVAAQGFTAYLADDGADRPQADAVDDLRRGWNQHVRFGLANPYLYSLAYGDARPGSSTPAAQAAAHVLAGLVHRVAEDGRLRVPEDRAVQHLVAAGCGTTLTLITTPVELRDPMFSESAREGVIAAITTDAPSAPESGTIAAAVHLRAALPHTSALTAREVGLLQEWLDRIVEPPAAPRALRRHPSGSV